MEFFTKFFCCLAFASILNWSPFLFLERFFSQPIYQLRKISDPSAIKPKNEYTIVLVGDSMTDYLGQAEELTKDLKKYYPDKKINIKNFSVGSTNILTLPDRLQNLTNYNSSIHEAILNTNFDIIIIESFGNNPLGDVSVEEGIRKHNATLDLARKMIKNRQPQAKIILLATIAPHKSRYAEGVANLKTEERMEWAKQRVAYIKNHINYAKNNNLPLINVYEKSLDQDSGGNIDLINTNDFIHPSVTCIKFISQEIADYIFQTRALPL